MLYEIEVLNWEKYQQPDPRIKNPQWFKLYPKFFGHPDFVNFTATELLFFLYCLSICCEAKAGKIKVETRHAYFSCKAKAEYIRSAVFKLEQNQTIRVISPCKQQGVLDCIGEDSIGLERKKRKIPSVRATSNGSAASGSEVWKAYVEAFKAKYKVEPKRNATTNAQVSNIVKRLGEADAIEVVRFYVSHNDRWYVRQGHSIGLCLKDAEKLFAEWKSGKKITSVTAATAESQDHNRTVAENYLKKCKQKEQLELEGKANEREVYPTLDGTSRDLPS